jgi:hypothetical protein
MVVVSALACRPRECHVRIYSMESELPLDKDDTGVPVNEDAENPSLDAAQARASAKQ